jgi:enoyl-CoA hydratase/carnithine racemase
VQRLAQALEAGAPLALRGMKLSLNEIARGSFDAATLDERVRRCATSDDLREGLAAFSERRSPRFVGR